MNLPIRISNLIIPRSAGGIRLFSVVTSLVVHASVAWGMVAGLDWLLKANDRVVLSGRQGVVTIQASFAAPANEEPVVEIPLTDASVVVTPHEARIDQQIFVEKSPQQVAEAVEPVLLDELQPREIAPPPPPPSSPVKPAEVRHNLASAAVSEPPFKQVRPTSALPASAPSQAALPQLAGLQDVTGPSFAHNTPPVYPLIAQQNKWQGTVTLKIKINELGEVTAVTIHESSGHAVLDAAAAQAVRQWKGEPARRFGRPIATEELQPVVFRWRLQ